MACNSIALSKFLWIEVDIGAFSHTWQHLIICCIQPFQRDNFLLDEQFDINQVAVTSWRYFAYRKAIEIKLEDFYQPITSNVSSLYFDYSVNQIRMQHVTPATCITNSRQSAI